jgi:hypothetical protein
LRTRVKSLRLTVVAGSLLALSAVLSGCHTNYPAVGGTSRLVTSNNPNDVGPERCVVGALRWVLAKYPPRAVAGGPMPEIAINLPPGTRKSYYERIATMVGPSVRPLTPEIWESKRMPVYHVSRVWVREQQAKVDVLRPMFELGPAPDGRPIYQLIEVHLRGPFQWDVVLGRSRSEPGLVPVPGPWFVPATDNPNEFRDWARAEAGGLPPVVIEPEGRPRSVAPEPVPEVVPEMAPEVAPVEVPTGPEVAPPDGAPVEEPPVQRPEPMPANPQ